MVSPDLRIYACLLTAIPLSIFCGDIFIDIYKPPRLYFSHPKASSYQTYQIFADNTAEGGDMEKSNRKKSTPDSYYTQVGSTIVSLHDELAKDLTARRHAALAGMFTQYGVEPGKLFEYSLYEISYLANAIANGNTGLFTEYIDWAKSLFESKGIPLAVLVKNLELVQETMLSGLPPESHDTITEFIRAGMDTIKGPSPEICSFIDQGSPYSTLAQQYLDAALAGDRPSANRLIMEAFGSGVSISDIYLSVLQPSQYEIGRMWQTNRITVAQEHFASGVTQMIMSQLYYPHICSMKKTGGTMLAICVSGELHEIGIRMVSDLFEMNGWNVTLLGANMPAYDIVESLLKHKAGVLGISAAMASSVNKAGDIIKRVKNSAVSQTYIIVGGFAFNRDPQLWRLIGADDYARDARDALEIAEIKNRPEN